MRLIYVACFAALICLAGTLYRLGRWFLLPLGPESRKTTPGNRVMGAVRALTKPLHYPQRLRIVLRAFLLEVIFQRRILRQNPLRWAIHLSLCCGILLLLLTHTFDQYSLARLFSDYASTLNPYMFLRNLLGLLVLTGVIAALIRHRKHPPIHGTTRSNDRLMLFLIAALIISGAALEAAQIISPALFDRMVEDYMGSDDPEEITCLKSYWAEYFSVAFTPPPAVEEKLLNRGARIHADDCAACHSRPVSAVLAYPLAKSIKPLGASMVPIGLEKWLWYTHYLISCLALALLPFTRLFHLLATPVSLMTRSLGPAAVNLAVNRPTRRAMGLDACTHCGECSRHCPVAPVYQVIPNPTILPSEKLSGVAGLAAGRATTLRAMQLAEGSFICTDCGRCTHWCPAGIDLRDLWEASRNDLCRDGFPNPHGWMQRHTASTWAEILAEQGLPESSSPPHPAVRLSDNPDTFWGCVQCSVCTSVCPVVAVSPDPQGELGMTPQQVMNLLRLQLKEMAMGASMVWNCVTCYKCQEHCPQGIRVADVLYELRNEACRRLSGTGRTPPDAAHSSTPARPAKPDRNTGA